MKKAKTGEPCNRCGSCCEAMPCMVGMALLGDHRLCAALQDNDDGTRSCGLVVNPGQYIDMGERAAWKEKFFGNMVARLIGIGEGCDTDATMKAIGRDMSTKKGAVA